MKVAFRQLQLGRKARSFAENMAMEYRIACRVVQRPDFTEGVRAVIVDKDTIPIPATAYFDLYDPKFSYNENGATRTRNGVFLSNDKHTFYIYLLNIDNKGTEYTWVIRDKQYLRRVVDFGFLN